MRSRTDTTKQNELAARFQRRRPFKPGDDRGSSTSSNHRPAVGLAVDSAPPTSLFEKIALPPSQRRRQLRMMPAAAFVFEPDLAHVDAKRVGKPSGDEAAMAPCWARLWRFPTEKRRDLSISDRLKLSHDPRRIEWVQDFIEVATTKLFVGNRLEPAARIKRWVSTIAALPARNATRDTDAGVMRWVEFRAPGSRRYARPVNAQCRTLKRKWRRVLLATGAGPCSLLRSLGDPCRASE